MRRDNLAICPSVLPDGRGADMMRPFSSWLTGSLLVLGSKPHAYARAGCAPGVSVVTTADGNDLSASVRFDAVLLLDFLPHHAVGAGRRLEASITWARARLRPGGRLILAIDNALSLNGFAHGAEAPGRGGFPSLEGSSGPNGLRLPTRVGLRRSLQTCGLIHQAWWFPFPDRAQPVSLVAERGLARQGGFDPGALAIGAAGPEPGSGDEALFSLRRAWRQVVDEGLAADLAPAFLVAASEEPLPQDDRLAIHIGLRRRPEFERLVTFVAAGSQIHVRRTRRYPDLPPHVDGVANLLPSEAYVPGPLWSSALDAQLARDGWCLDAVAAWAGTWLEAVSRSFVAGAALKPETILPGSALDAIPKNLVAGPINTFIDLEWDLGAPLDQGHLAVRGLVNALIDVPDWGRSGSSGLTLLDALQALLPRLGLALDDAQLADRLARESRFQSIVSGHATERGLGWAAATRLPAGGSAEARAVQAGSPRAIDDAAAEIARLREENDALRAARALDAAAHEAAGLESARRTDRVIAYAAELHRARDQLEATLAARLAPSGRVGRLPLRLRRLLGRTT